MARHFIMVTISWIILCPTAVVDCLVVTRAVSPIPEKMQAIGAGVSNRVSSRPTGTTINSRTRVTNPKLKPHDLQTVPVTTIPSFYDQRRGMICGLFAGIGLYPPCNAADPTTVGESIRSAATKGLPSYYGPTDVFYPSSWKGLWNARRVRTDGSIAASFQIRFITSIQDGSVVLDRGFSQASLEKTKGVVRTVWVETNPNVLRVDYDDGSWKELKVTQRATERTDSTVSCSEVYRITTQSSGLGAPSITARRVMTKWKAIDETKVEGIELIYDTNLDAPTLLAKTKIILER